MICLDDYNQNHLNDGLVTITGIDRTVPLPSYANRTNFNCDPITGELVYNTETVVDYNKLTQNQVYALTQIANAKLPNSSENKTAITNFVNNNSYNKNPFVQDVFGMIPIKVSGLQNGQVYVEFGGSLQLQDRTYFGPVNIRRMTVKLLNDKGEIVDLNNANWSFSLVCEQLYNPNPQK